MVWPEHFQRVVLIEQLLGNQEDIKAKFLRWQRTGEDEVYRTNEVRKQLRKVLSLNL